MTVIPQWAPQTGYERRTPPSTKDTWSQTESPVAMYLLHLRALGFLDQTSHLGRSATEHYRHAIFLRDQTVSVVAAPDEREAIAKRLALAEISPEEAQRRLAKAAPKVADAQDLTDQMRRTISDATREAYSHAVAAIRAFDWLSLLRLLAQEAVAARDDVRFDALHRFAALLRSPGLAALAMVASDTAGIREFDETWRYKVGRPDLYHAWRFERAEQSQARGYVNVGSDVFVATVVTKGPHPTLADMSEMESGIYSAAEVLAITEAILAEQGAALVGAETAAASPHRARARRATS